ncbi:MAG: ABC transporter permease [Thermomicrobiales bacterium]|nr:ABC transporter permease [Thermomicrobiales bacterium]
MNRRSTELFLTIAGPALLLLVWEVLSRLEVISPFYWPAPSKLWGTAVEMFRDRGLWSDITASLWRIFAGFVIGTVPGVLLGLAMGLWWPVRIFFMPLASAIYAIPKIAILPLVIIAFGIGELSKIMIVAISIFFMIALSTMSGVLAIDDQFHDVATNLGANRWQMIVTVALPGSLPAIFTGMRLALGFALIVIVGTEFLAAKEGIGFVIWQNYQILRIKEMFVGLIITGLMGWAMNLALDVVERYAIPWRSQ